MKKLLLAIVLIVGCKKGEVNIEHSCTINGFGKANCVFTNKGDADGSVCIQITMTRNRPRKDYIAYVGGNGEENTSLNNICSGIVKAGDVEERVKTLSFIHNLSDTFCNPTYLIRGLGKSWVDVCTMSTKVVSKDQ